VIVMPLRYQDGQPLFGKALQTVMEKRPCRVIVAANPALTADGERAPAPGRVG
jgi:hypothetical protein